jgi:hypothetical protein
MPPALPPCCTHRLEHHRQRTACGGLIAARVLVVVDVVQQRAELDEGQEVDVGDAAAVGWGGTRARGEAESVRHSGQGGERKRRGLVEQPAESEWSLC